MNTLTLTTASFFENRETNETLRRIKNFRSEEQLGALIGDLSEAHDWGIEETAKCASAYIQACLIEAVSKVVHKDELLSLESKMTFQSDEDREVVRDAIEKLGRTDLPKLTDHARTVIQDINLSSDRMLLMAIAYLQTPPVFIALKLTMHMTIEEQHYVDLMTGGNLSKVMYIPSTGIESPFVA